MNWGIMGLALAEGARVAEAIERNARERGLTRNSRDVKDQLAAVAAAVQGLVDSRCLGSGTYVATLQGFANPGHERQPGQGNDAITITLTQAG